ncbi:MAG TPA: type II CAAX endopeptidase family protein [Chloroflexota bacterium]|nr:type II CAAX endopeptidase family protein [Chloroflexota bacterium]HUM71797.1 type II CAAX endopeptidase family protein [Chloroflexota bacterium]
MKATVQRYSLFFYFVLAYGIAWGGSLFVAAARGFDPGNLGLSDIFIMFLFMLAGPSLASVVLTAGCEGKPGLNNLFARLKEWHVSWRWGAVAVLTVPTLATITLLLLSTLASPIYKPGVTLAALGFGIVAGSLAGFFEEIGWTGFALPRLQARYNPLASGLILGVLWAFWHIMADYWGNFAAFDLYWLPTFILFWFMPLTAYRVLMVWVHQNSPSLPLMQIMHAFYSGTLGVVGPTTSVEEGLLWKALFAASLWVMLTVVVVRFGGDLSRQRHALKTSVAYQGDNLPQPLKQ